MQVTCPRNFLSPADIGVLLLPGLSGIGDMLAHVEALDLPITRIETLETPPWNNDDLIAALKPPQWRQLLIIADRIASYETSLSLMTLEIGFQVYLSVNKNTEDSLALARLRQASAIILSHEDVIAELALHNPADPS